MTPFLLISIGLVVIGFTIWNTRREEADILFWTDIWWNVNKTKNPILYRIALALQILGALIMIGIGAAWLLFFR